MKKSLFDLCVSTLREGREAADYQQRLQQALTDVRAMLAAISDRNEEIRLFVGGSINYGHQSTSIVIMNRLIDLGVRRIRIIYQKSTNTNPDLRDEETTTKLTKLIANLTEADIAGAAAFLYRGAEIFFSEYTVFAAAAGAQVTLGISGGFDATTNICRSMKVKCLLVLQPFRYQKAFARNMLYFHPDLFREQNAITLPAEFLQKGFYIEDPPKPVTYLGTPQADLAALEQQIRQDYRTEQVAGILKRFQKKRLLWTDEATFSATLLQWFSGVAIDPVFAGKLWEQFQALEVEANNLQELQASNKEDEDREVAGAFTQRMQPGEALSDEWKRKTVQTVLNLLQQPVPAVHLCPVYFSIGRTRFRATTILFNLLTGFLARRNAANENPIVILTMSKFEEGIYRMLEWIMSGEERYWDETSTDERVIGLRKWSPFLCKAARAAMLAKDYFTRFQKVRVIHAGDDVASAITQVGKGGIVLVNLQRVPKPVFEYLYSVSTLPGIFEGEATASLILNLGRPFFHIESSDEQTYSLYPFPIIPSGLLGQQAVSEYCVRFSNYFGDAAWQEANTPDLAIARYIEDAYTLPARPQDAAPLQLYFKSMRSFFHDALEDKLLQALLLAMLEMKRKGL